jgi:hypothetical protein
MVCGAGGKEAVGATAARLAWILAQRGNRVMLVQETEAMGVKLAHPLVLRFRGQGDLAWPSEHGPRRRALLS